MKLTQEQKSQFEKITSKIKDRTGWDVWKIQLWMKQSNPHMGDISPSEAIMKGKFDSLWSFVEDGSWKT
jgi:predicted nucleotidyltransferase